MKLTVQIKFGSSKQEIVRFGGDRYLVYLKFKKEEPGAMGRFLGLMSAELGVSPEKIEYLRRQGENHLFEIN